MPALEKQKFYIIGHNPNTVEHAKGYVDAGANALEPDVCFSPKHSHPDRYYVSHDHISTNPDSYDFDHKHSLKAYMRGLAELVVKHKYNLALLYLDYKDSPDGNVNDVLKIVHDNFTQHHPRCAGVAILASVPHISVAHFVNGYNQSIVNAGVFIDQDDNAIGVRDNFVKAKQKKFGYADGIMVGGSPIGIFKSVMKAKVLQAQAKSPDHQFKMVQTWVLAKESSMRAYLDLHIDGINVNVSTVPTLKGILRERHFAAMYELAQNGYNPWTAAAPPQYWGSVETSNKISAGTDGKVRLTLKGDKGSLACPIDGSWAGVLGKGDSNDVTWQGLNIGTITSLKAELAEEHGVGPDWLPRTITVGSTLMPHKLFFNFGPDDWVKHGHPITKHAEQKKAAHA